MIFIKFPHFHENDFSKFQFIPTEKDSSKTVLEGIARVQDVASDTNYAYPNPTAIYITIQGSNDGQNWLTLFQPWVIVSKLNSLFQKEKL
jgi:hypothetical protein